LISKEEMIVFFFCRNLNAEGHILPNSLYKPEP